jgi:hypothetical protein
MREFLLHLNSSQLLPGLGQLAPEKWNLLIKRLGEIKNPEVPIKPSSASLPDEHGNNPGSGSGGTRGED